MKKLFENWRKYINEISYVKGETSKLFFENVNYLYHITSARNEESIMRKGLLPRHKNSGWGPTPYHDAVYLVGKKGVEYPIKGIAGEGEYRGHNKLLIIKVDLSNLDRDKFVADEDCISYKNDKRDLYDFNDIDLAAACFFKNYTIAYSGKILPVHFDAYEVFRNTDREHNIQINKVKTGQFENEKTI